MISRPALTQPSCRSVRIISELWMGKTRSKVFWPPLNRHLWYSKCRYCRWPKYFQMLPTVSDARGAVNYFYTIIVSLLAVVVTGKSRILATFISRIPIFSLCWEGTGEGGPSHGHWEMGWDNSGVRRRMLSHIHSHKLSQTSSAGP